MQISKRSWHYRLLKRTGHQPYEIPDDLCGYMRRVGFTVFVVVPLFCVLGPIVIGLMWLEKHLFPRVVSGIARVFTRKPPPEDKPESLFRAWLRAKKERICPLIEFTDEGI